jgi:hypothetical protein
MEHTEEAIVLSEPVWDNNRLTVRGAVRIVTDETGDILGL